MVACPPPAPAPCAVVDPKLNKLKVIMHQADSESIEINLK